MIFFLNLWTRVAARELKLFAIINGIQTMFHLFSSGDPAADNQASQPPLSGLCD
jgi:hypothetical protein